MGSGRHCWVKVEWLTKLQAWGIIVRFSDGMSTYETFSSTPFYRMLHGGKFKRKWVAGFLRPFVEWKWKRSDNVK